MLKSNGFNLLEMWHKSGLVFFFVFFSVVDFDEIVLQN